MAINQMIVDDLKALQLEIESVLINTNPGVFNKLGSLQQHLTNLIELHPKEAAVFINEFRVLPYLSMGEVKMEVADKFIKPTYKIAGTPKVDINPTDGLEYPDGPQVVLQYEFGYLKKMFWLTAADTYDLTKLLWLLVGSTPNYIDDWSELPLQTIEGILAIAKSTASSMNEVNLKPIEETTASYDAIKNVFNKQYVGSVTFFPLGDYPEGFVIYNRDNFYLTHLLEKDTLYPIKPVPVKGVINGVRWKVNLKGYLYLTLDIAVEQTVVHINVINYFQLILQGFCIGTEINLLKKGVDYYFGDNRHISSTRKIFPPKVSPINGTKLLYEGSNGMTLFLKDVSVANSIPSTIVRIRDRNNKLTGRPYPEDFLTKDLRSLFELLIDIEVKQQHDEFLYSLGINGLNRLNAHLVAKQVTTADEIWSTLNDPKKLHECGIHWTSIVDITNNLKHALVDFEWYVKNALIDFNGVLVKPKVVGVVGTLKVTRHELGVYFNHYGVDLIEESLTEASVVLVGAQTSDYVLSNLERLGVMLIPCDHYLDLTLLINEVKRYVEE